MKLPVLMCDEKLEN